MVKFVSKQRKWWIQTLGIVLLMIYVSLMSLYSLRVNEDRDRKLEALKVEFDSLTDKHSAVEEELDTIKANSLEINSRKKRSMKHTADFYAAYGGAVYVRWGRTTCPDGNDTELVYKGIAGGSHYTHEGAGTNIQCLPAQPEWGRFDDGAYGTAFMYGMEYEDNMDNIMKHQNIQGPQANQNVPCAVCRNKFRPSALMIPGLFSCTEGWFLEYRGYIMTGHYTHKAGSQYLCVDEDPEADPAGYRDENGALLYRVEAVCGSLPCPPYVNNRELSCVVCTK